MGESSEAERANRGYGVGREDNDDGYHDDDGAKESTGPDVGSNGGIFPLHRLVAVWAGEISDPNDEDFILRIGGALSSRRAIQNAYAKDPVGALRQ